MNKQYTFSLPPEVGVIIDRLPKTQKSAFIAEAVVLTEKFQSQKKVLSLLDSIKPISGASSKSSVELVNEARNARSDQLISNFSANG